jgi:hypothetical protein
LQIKGLCVKRRQKRTQNEPVLGVNEPKKRPTEPRKGPTKLSFGFEKRGTGDADLGQYEPLNPLDRTAGLVKNKAGECETTMGVLPQPSVGQPKRSLEIEGTTISCRGRAFSGVPAWYFRAFLSVSYNPWHGTVNPSERFQIASRQELTTP